MQTINYRRMFAEAVELSLRDHYAEHHELLIAGYWLIRLNKRAPLIPARTYWTTCEPGTDNELDRWPLPILAGEILGEVADPLDIFSAPFRKPLVALNRSSVELTIEQHYRYRVADARHAKHYRPQDPLSRPRRAVDLSNAPLLF